MKVNKYTLDEEFVTLKMAQPNIFGLFHNKNPKNIDDYWIQQIFAFTFHSSRSSRAAKDNPTSWSTFGTPITHSPDINGLEDSEDFPCIFIGTEEKCKKECKKARGEKE